jgi:protein SCO1/2
MPAPDFTLTDQNGNAFTLSSTRGKVVLLYFGYTSCPDVCPMTLVDLAAVRANLGDAAREVQVIFVTVDPARDTEQVLKKYVTAFDESFMGLRGTDDITKSVAGAFGAKYKKTSLPNSALGYAMDHSAFIYVIDRNGRLRETFPFGAAREDILNDLTILTQEGVSS